MFAQALHCMLHMPSGLAKHTAFILRHSCRAGGLPAAVDVAAALLPAYEHTLNVPYALPKLDLVAIPEFSLGGMENWGIITFEEAEVLATNESELQDRRSATSLIAHELAHQVCPVAVLLLRPSIVPSSFVHDS